MADRPLILKTPKLNLDAFQSALDRQLQDAQGHDLKTRAEVRLEEGMQTITRLDNELAETRGEKAKTQHAIAELNKLLVMQEANEADLVIEREAVLQQNHSLQQNNVRSPGDNNGNA